MQANDKLNNYRQLIILDVAGMPPRIQQRKSDENENRIAATINLFISIKFFYTGFRNLFRRKTNRRAMEVSFTLRPYGSIRRPWLSIKMTLPKICSAAIGESQAGLASPRRVKQD